MIANIFLNVSNENKISREFLKYIKELEILNHLKKNNLINDEDYLKIKINLKKLHIGKI